MRVARDDNVALAVDRKPGRFVVLIRGIVVVVVLAAREQTSVWPALEDQHPRA
jgi:hypothetical protein